MGVKKADIFCTAYPEMLATGQGFAEEIAKCLLSGGDGCGMGILDEYQTAEFNRRLLKFAESVKTSV